MNLQAYVSHAVNGVVGRVRRDAIAGAICAVCAIAVVVLTTWAAVLALTLKVGAIYAPLIVAGGYLVIILGTVLWLQVANGRKPQVAPAPGIAGVDPAQRQAQFAQVAMIVEALMLGFSLSRRFDRR